MSTSLVPLLDQALTDLEALEKRVEAGHVSDARHWPSLSLSIRKLASTTVELVNMPETRNRTNRAPMISFCARMKTIALIFHETISTREVRAPPMFPTPGSGKIARSGKPGSYPRHQLSSGTSSKETDALLVPELSTHPTLSPSARNFATDFMFLAISYHIILIRYAKKYENPPLEYDIQQKLTLRLIGHYRGSHQEIVGECPRFS